MNLRSLFLLFAWSALAPVQADDLEVGLLELVNYYEYSPDLLSAGQPTREQFPAIKSAGVEAIVNLAPVTDPASIPEEHQIVGDLKIAYTHIPVDWENPTQADYDRFLAAMKQYAGKRVLVHCYAGSRASAFTYLYRVNELKVPSQGAREIMLTLWANSPGYEFHKMPQWRAFVARAER
jgi:protein tyrosine phosphatase (PTP) superfamily phosphohydrolase (DUF442 family)